MNTNQSTSQELASGTNVEKEHTQDTALAQKIASDHLREDPRYYSKLKAAGLDEEEAMVVSIGGASVNGATPNTATSTVCCGGKQSQKALASSGLGKAQKPLTSSGIKAPETKIINNKNTIANTKTPGMKGEPDQLNHFYSQIGAALKDR